MAKTYDTYKDSGIAWIGEIPSEWVVCKMKNTIRFINGYAFDSNSFKAEGIYPVIRIGDIINEKISYDNTVFVNDNTGLENFQIHDNDILIAMSGATTGKVGKVQSNHNGYINQRVGIIRCANHSYVYYHFLMDGFIDYVNLSSIGTAQPNISSNGILNFSFIKPSLSVQHSIASFLDTKCGEIDALISLQEEMISELQAYKQSVITEAVTKGLNPHAKMKDSGVEWIGEIPEGWAVCSTKHLFNLYSGATPKTDNDSFWDGNIPWITPADFKTEDVYISKGRRNITQNGVDSCGTTIVPANSVIFSKRAPIGLVVLNKEPLCTNQGCISCVPKETFSKYYYAMSVFTDSYELYGAGTTFMEISATSFANFKLPNPSFEEQQSIATYLDEKTSQIDTLIALKQEKIQELKDYKKSIIYEYVTGKKKV